MSKTDSKLIKATSCIIKNRDGKVLIVKRTPVEIGKDETRLTWVFPGGEVFAGETLEEAAKRDVLDETGFSIKVNKQISERDHPQFPAHIHYFACEILPEKVRPAWKLHEIESSKWVNPEDLKNYITSDLDPLVAKYLGL